MILRNMRFLFTSMSSSCGTWPIMAISDENFQKSLYEMKPYASGAAYQNYTDPTLKDWRKAYYGDAVTKLTKVKKQYDPEGFFSYPQSL